MKVWVAIGTFALGALAMLGIYLLVRRVVRWIHGAIGGTARSSFTGLCFAGLVAPEFVTSLARGLVQLAMDLLIHAPLAVYRSGRNMESSDRQQPELEPISIAADHLNGAFGQVRDWGVIGPETFVFLLVWLGVSSLLDRSADQVPAPPSEVSARPPLGFIALLLTSLFLSVAALVAIPTLTDIETRHGLTAEDLTKQIDAVTPTEAELAQFATLPTTPEALLAMGADLEKRLAPAPAVISVPAPATIVDVGGDADAPPPVPASVATAIPPVQPPATSASQADHDRELLMRVNQAKSHRAQIVQLYKSLIDSIRHGNNKDGKLAISKYQRQSLGRAGARETREHFDSLVTWYAWVSGQRIWLANACRLTMQTHHVMLEDWARHASRDHAAPPRQDLGYCMPSGGGDDPPNRPELGNGLSVMGLVANWLIKTESLTLAIIIGMLGFGMLGATLSTVIKEWKPGANWASVLRDGWAVFFRGLAAAFLVFVSVQGGGAVFTGANVSPNPYVLFFFCTLAGVFSEKIWRWGEKQLGDKVDRPPPAPPTPPPTPPTPPPG